MRHRVAHRKLGRVTAHRLAMLRSQSTALIRHEHLTTTVARAKELRPFVERLITVAKRGVAGRADEAAAAGTLRTLNARRLVMRELVDQQVITKLFDEIAPRFAARPGGYTRLLRLGFRKGDSAEVAQVELIGSEFNPKAKAETPAGEAQPQAKGVGGRLRAAADRLRGKKEEAPAGDDKAAKRAAGKGAPKARPRKQGAKGS